MRLEPDGAADEIRNSIVEKRQQPGRLERVIAEVCSSVRILVVLINPLLFRRGLSRQLSIVHRLIAAVADPQGRQQQKNHDGCAPP
ncbi:uncharacterized protein METZ01_LOCUS152852, partial [marine metagenome]